jgi:hypothetical protein
MQNRYYAPHYTKEIVFTQTLPTVDFFVFRKSMKRSHRYITSLLLTSIYLLIVFSPLTPLALQSKVVTHAITGECSGDCKIDGCSLERSAAHTCCCWQKKPHDDDTAHHTASREVSENHPSQLLKATKKSSSCCPEKKLTNRGNVGKAESIATSSPQKNRTATISSSHCGNGKIVALLNVNTASHLPFFYSKAPTPRRHSLLACTTPDRLTSRYNDPPEPPPIISLVS